MSSSAKDRDATRPRQQGGRDQVARRIACHLRCISHVAPPSARSSFSPSPRSPPCYAIREADIGTAGGALKITGQEYPGDNFFCIGEHLLLDRGYSRQAFIFSARDPAPTRRSSRSDQRTHADLPGSLMRPLFVRNFLIGSRYHAVTWACLGSGGATQLLGHTLEFPRREMHRCSALVRE